jgi:EpsI family protein
MKKLISIPHLLIGLALLFAAGLALAMKPTIIFADQHEKIDLEVLIPKQFNDWRAEDMATQLVNPQTEAAINKIYAQTLSRNYVNDKGQHIMLSIAYGKNQTDSVGVHLPEGCYAGQGFSIQNSLRGTLKTAFGYIPASRLVATQGERVEPITYWLTVGEKAVYGGWNMKKARLYYALRGVVPDGFLMRVSSITPNFNEGYALQDRFSQDLLLALTPQQRLRLMGKSDTSNPI